MRTEKLWAGSEASKGRSKTKCRILICAGTGCLAGGSGEIYERMCELVEEHPDVEVNLERRLPMGMVELG